MSALVGGGGRVFAAAGRIVAGMGLGISVGMQCDQARNDPEGFEFHRDGFDRLTRALAAEGIRWREPEVLHETGEHDFSAGFPYSFLMHLRRSYALTQLGEPVTPAADTSDEQYERDKAKIEDETSMLSSHLLCHADHAGYYIPVDFADPLFLPEEAQIYGYGMVGSSQRLLAELVSFAPAIGVQLDDDGVLSVAQEAELAAAANTDRFDAEKYAWLGLYRACLTSVESGHAIVFC